VVTVAVAFARLKYPVNSLGKLKANIRLAILQLIIFAAPDGQRFFPYPIFRHWRHRREDGYIKNIHS